MILINAGVSPEKMMDKMSEEVDGLRQAAGHLLNESPEFQRLLTDLNENKLPLVQ